MRWPEGVECLWRIGTRGRAGNLEKQWSPRTRWNPRLRLWVCLGFLAAACSPVGGKPPGLDGSGTVSGAGGSLVNNTGGALAGNSGGALAGNSGGALAGNADGALVGNPAELVAAFAGVVSGSSALVGNSGGALVGNTGGALVGNTGGALVGNSGGALVGSSGGALAGNSGGTYRALGLAQSPIAGAFVYLTSPDERFFALGGKTLITTTGPDGRYDFGGAILPDGQYVVVNALLEGNRRLVGFAVSRAGTNSVDVDVASTYVLEFLRAEARRVGKTLDAYPLDRLPGLVARTRQMLAAGTLSLEPDHLVVGDSKKLSDAYVTAFAARDPELALLWTEMLGDRPVAVLTLGGTFGFGPGLAATADARTVSIFNPAAVAVSGGRIVVAAFGGHQILELGPDGQAYPLSAPYGGDPTAGVPPPVPVDGAVGREAIVPQPLGLAFDASGNLFVTLNSQSGAPRNAVFMLAAEGSAKFGRTGLVAGRIYRIAGSIEPRTDDTGFFRPVGMAVDDGGNLFVADQQNHRIVRIDRQSGRMVPVAGSPAFPPPRLVDRDAVATASGLLAPTAVAWQRSGADELLYVLDSLHQRIRLVTAPGGNWASAGMRTLAGSGQSVQSGSATVVAGGFLGDGGQGAAARFHIARADLWDWRGSEMGLAGLALDASRGRLYVADAVNGRVRALDLSTGVVSTLGGGGTNPRDGLAARVEFGSPSGLAIDASGSVVVADYGRHAVRRVTPPD